MLPAHNDSWLKKNDRPQNQNSSGTKGQHPWKYFLHNSMKVFRRFKQTVPGAEVEEQEKKSQILWIWKSSSSQNNCTHVYMISDWDTNTPAQANKMMWGLMSKDDRLTYYLFGTKRVTSSMLPYVHKDNKDYMGSPGQPPWLSHSSWALRGNKSCQRFTLHILRVSATLINSYCRNSIYLVLTAENSQQTVFKLETSTLTLVTACTQISI